MKLEIRKATLRDINLLIAMRTAFITQEHPDLSGEQIEAMVSNLREYYPRHLNRDFWAYFAETDGQAAAVAYLLIQERPANTRLPSGIIATILNVYTIPAFRRRGLASALLREAMEDAKQLGASVIELLASEMGRGVYEKTGVCPQFIRIHANGILFRYPKRRVNPKDIGFLRDIDSSYQQASA